VNRLPADDFDAFVVSAKGETSSGGTVKSMRLMKYILAFSHSRIRQDDLENA